MCASLFAGAEPQPYLAGNRFKPQGGWLSSFIDVWLFFPRAGLLQLIPAMAGLQQLLYAAAGKAMWLLVVGALESIALRCSGVL